MLNNTTIKQLVKTLNKELCNDKNYISIDGEITHDYDGHLIKIPISCWNFKSISNICDKMMWIPTVILTSNGSYIKYQDSIVNCNINNFVYIGVEPLKGINMDSYVKECNYNLYHICRKSSVNKILSKGLIMKGSNSEYRLMKDKTFVICGKTQEKLFNNIKEVANSISLFNGKLNKFSEDFALIKINAKNYNVSYYKDTAYGINSEGILFTYAYFSPSMLKEVTEDFLHNFYTR